jgi:hypothetical protein
MATRAEHAAVNTADVLIVPLPRERNGNDAGISAAGDHQPRAQNRDSKLTYDGAAAAGR